MTEKEFDLPKMKRLYVKAKEAYFNKAQSIMTDAEFDLLERKIKSLDPKWSELHKTGKFIPAGNVVTALHIRMPSLHKVTTDEPEAVDRFLTKRIKSIAPNAVVMDKLDGCSLQLVYNNGVLRNVITRGDGELGKSAASFIPYINSIPKKIDTQEPVVVIRAEALFSKDVFEKTWLGVYESSRAAASSLLGRLDVHKALADLRVVCLRVLQPAFAVSSGLDWLDRLGFETVVRRSINLSLKDSWVSQLSRYYDKRKEESLYDIDGLVIFSDANKLPAPTKDKPSYAVAFKKNVIEDSVKTVVEEVVWNVSSYGVIVPKARIRPITIDGSEITYAALHNAAWAHKRNIGPGTVVRVIKSGGIIPKIVLVSRPTKFSPPDPEVFGEYKWDDTRVNLVLSRPASSDAVRIARLTRFFKEIELDGFSEGIAKKLVGAGFTSVPKMLDMELEDWASLPGVKASAKTYFDSVQRLKSRRQDIVKLLPASGCFDKGVGTARVMLLVEKAPHLIKNKPATQEWKYEVAIVAGQVFSETLYSGWDKFLRWLRLAGLKPYIPNRKAESKEGLPLSGMYGSWTGYRSADEERTFVQLGGTVIPFGSKTTVLFFNAEGKKSSKIEKAHSLGIATVSAAGPWMSRKAVEHGQ